ncbi:MAG: SURF1 family protein [Roseovarius sp.]
MSRYLIPFLFGLIGCAILVSLGMWQVQRLAWKENILHEIDTTLLATPVALPAAPQETPDEYLPVTVTGRFDADTLRVLVSQKQIGAGYRLITALETPQRRVLVDRGFIKVDTPLGPAPEGAVTVEGNLLWPDDRNSSTPDNDVAGNIWFARDVEQMAQALNTDAVLVIARNMSQPDPNVTPLPVDTSAVPNDHLSYAVTWFSLAGIWAIMTFYFMWRMRHPLRKA